MKTVSTWQHLEPYGIVPLSGEACGLSYRLLCDVTEKGRKVLGKLLGAPKLTLGEAWNRGRADDPHVGSLMVPYDWLVPIAVFALLENGCFEAWALQHGVIGIEPTDDLPLCLRFYGQEKMRRLSYRGTAQDRNVHAMTGRIE